MDKVDSPTRNVPQPYTRPSSVSAKLQLSPAATWTNVVPEGNSRAGIGVGVDSRGFRSSSSEESASISRRLPSQSVSLLKGTSVIHAPGEDLIVFGQSHRVHTTAVKLNDTKCIGALRVQIWVRNRTEGFLLLGAKAELTTLAIAKH